MADTGKLDSLRPNRLQGDRVLIALALSVLAHALLFGAYELRGDLHLPPKLRWLVLAKPLPVPQPHFEQPLEFVTVATPSTESPKNTPYYSNKSSVAANPDANKDANKPKIDGTQTEVPRTEDVYHPQFSKSTTGAAAQQQQNNAQESTEAKTAQNSGDLTLGKPEDTQEEKRPRTLKDAYAEMAKKMPGLMMKQEGGVNRHAAISSLDVQLTGFGDYDSQFIDTVSQNWFGLLDSHKFALDRIGKVVLLFRLNDDGTISQMRFEGNTVGDLLGYVCEKAILDGAPYQSWSESMRLQLGTSRDMKFTFYYQ